MGQIKLPKPAFNIALLVALSPVGQVVIYGTLIGTSIGVGAYLTADQLLTASTPALVTLDHKFKKVLKEEFQRAAVAHSAAAWSLVHGSIGNLVVGLTGGIVGDGCACWQDWMLNTWWPSVQNKLFEGRPWNQFVSPFAVHYKDRVPLLGTSSGKFVHNLVQLTYLGMPGVKRYQILDPWRNPNDPVWDTDLYEQTFGKIIEDSAFGYFDSFIDFFSGK